MSFSWVVTPTAAWIPGTQAYIARIHMAVFRLAQSYTPRIEAWMKTNAPWQDISGNARQTLYSDVFDLVNSAVVIVMAHGVEYGVFLEWSNAGRYSILSPALDHFAPLIWQDVQRLLRP